VTAHSLRRSARVTVKYPLSARFLSLSPARRPLRNREARQIAPRRSLAEFTLSEAEGLGMTGGKRGFLFCHSERKPLERGIYAERFSFLKLTQSSPDRREVGGGRCAWRVSS